MRYRLQRHDGTDCSATMVPITVLRMVSIQRYRQLEEKKLYEAVVDDDLVTKEMTKREKKKYMKQKGL